ncbi:MAG TPA: DNA repair protein RecN [Flavitalea sp.]|nr:DNA repair protein RecN [Flavitalea sp.]
MLNRLHIQNYAIIDDIDIDFSAKLNIITGETGAGKSILMGALSLILGDRADLSVLQNRDKKCFIEAVFATEKKNNIREFLKSEDLDIEEELVIRREINVNGKSRAFVNDTPVNLDQLRRLSSMLVDLHQQFDTLELGDAGFQREVIDALAAHTALLAKYQSVYQQWVSAAKELDELRGRKEQFTKEFDYNKFLFDELEEAAFRDNELEDADAELNLLSNSEGIKSALQKVSYDLLQGEEPIVPGLKSLFNQLQGYASYHQKIPEIISRLQSAQLELQDIADDVESVGDHVQYDPRRIEELNDRIALGYKLLKKHVVKSTADLLAIKAQLEEKLQAVLNIDELISSKQLAFAAVGDEAAVIAGKLSMNRKKQIAPLENKVNELLIKVGMPNARLKVQISGLSSLSDTGLDKIELLFDANKSNRFEPIRKVASGGELSRLMLCIKSLVAESLDLPTLIFDEIDTGISGEAAKQVGIIMKGLSKKRQVISITHQPQIAGKADAHFFVYKQTQGGTIKTNIRVLSQEERITAIAKMLGGEKPTAAALENAREMVSS